MKAHTFHLSVAVIHPHIPCLHPIRLDIRSAALHFARTTITTVQLLRSLSFCVLCLPTALYAQLSGTYTIGPAGTYTTFNAAVTALATQGLSGPVLFEVADGNYTEQIVLSNIPGNSATNTITFRGQSLDSSAVSLGWPTGLFTPTLRFSGADHVTFEHLTIERTGTTTLAGTCVDWGGTVGNPATRSTHIAFRNCRLRTTSAQTTTALVKGLVQNNEEQVRFLSCRFEGGPVGLQWSMNVAQLALTVSKCHFSGQRSRGIQLIDPGTGQPEVLIEENTLESPSQTGAITVDVAHNAARLRVARNRISCTASNGTALSLTVNGVDPTVTVVRNNMLVGSLNARGMLIAGTTNGLGIVYNAVSTAFGRGVEITAGGTGNLFVGNAVRSSVQALYHSGTLSFTMADHNVLHSTGTSWVHWNGTNYTDVHTLRCATGQYMRSLQADPRFVDPATDLHVDPASPCLGQGLALAGVMEDFDGDVRSLPALTAPDIGADEVNGVCVGLSGTYVIGASLGADFPSFTAAVARLGSCGITGPVLFEVESGTYTERLLLGTVEGANSINTITFRGQALDSSQVVLQTASQSSTILAPNHLIRCYGCAHVRFEHMTLGRTGTLGFARVVDVDPSCRPVRDLRFAHCALTNGTTATTNGSLVFRQTAATFPAAIRMEACAYNSGWYAVEWNYNNGLGIADTVAITDGLRPIGANGFSISLVNGPVRVERCTLALGGTRAMNLSGVRGMLRVVGNTVRGGTGGSTIGIYLANCIPPVGVRNLVANNSVALSGVPLASVGDLDRCDLVHNSFRSNNAGAPAMRLFVLPPPVDVLVANNVLSALDDRAMTLNTTGVLAHYNCFQRNTPGALVEWNGVQYTTMAALQAGSGTHAASFTADPRFFDPALDLHAYAMELDRAAIPLPIVTTDIDGQPRDPLAPDIGADEFTPQLWAEALNTCAAADPIVSTGTGQDQWIYTDRKVVARFNDNGQALGTVNMNVYRHNGPVRQSLLGQHYLDRNWQLITQNPITAGAIVRLFHSGAEFVPFAAADPTVAVAADAGVAHYAGGGENCVLADNSTTGAAWQAHFPAAPGAEPRIQAMGGTFGYTAVLQTDGELYISGQATPLPVELLSFTAERTSTDQVELVWTTATEHNNAGFEVWRQLEGEPVFTRVAWVDGAGESQQLLHYHQMDANTANTVSYYQLRQLDRDGTGAWSAVVPVQGSAAQGLVVWPNPAHDRFTLHGAHALQGPVELRDASGRLVRSWTLPTSLDLHGISPGTYLVCLPTTVHAPVRLLVQ